VIITLDAAGTANFGWWYVTLNRSTLVTTIEYNDNEVSGGKITWIQTPDKCVVNSY